MKDSLFGELSIIGMRGCEKFVEEVNAEGLYEKVTVSQTGCIGYCRLEPIVEIYEAGKEKVTYIHMTPEKAKEVVEKHLKGGNVVTEYTVATVD